MNSDEQGELQDSECKTKKGIVRILLYDLLFS